MFKRTALSVFAALVFGSTAALAQEQPTTIEELWNIIQQQQAEIDALKAEVSEARQETATTNERVAVTEARVEETEERVEATGEYVESMAEVQAEPSRTTIGGYGELHYNTIKSDAGDSDEIDFHRFVLYFGHEFTDRVRLFSELELEHSLAGDGKPGEVELEQAYIDFVLNDKMSAKAGLFLLPVGILNEIHEPTTFYGVERNDVESIIVPSTWWEAGGALSGRLGNGLSWDAALHSGLAMPTTGSSAFRVRSGRQKVAEALASDWAGTFRLKYTGIPGLELAASYQYQSDPSQVPDDGLDSGHLFTTHAIYQAGSFGLRGLYGVWNFNGDAVEAAGADRQKGWYIEPSWRFNEKWGVYARYEDLDGARDQDQFTQSQIGLNYWPVPGVVFKIDYRDRDHSLPELAVRDFTAVDLGLGFTF
ncbi:MAG: porin [Xanthomonadales bacterium]|nr:OprO/OprP family phosphate-selective porin [Gammaproteobacteria bacterium]NND57416.1 porin [Xanthomonadales bacterium]NNK50345.1 porin [Xanthomonadales bacterium]